MATAKDNAGTIAATEAPTTPPAETSAATTAPLLVETPSIAENAEGATIDLATITPAEPAAGARPSGEAPEIAIEPADASVAEASQGHFARYAIAASILLAAALGGVAGAGATYGLLHEPVAAADKTVVDATRKLQDGAARMVSELSAVRFGLEAALKTTNAQFSKLAERLERAERAQSEPAAKLAKIAEAVDRLERRPAQIAQPAHAATSVSADITGSVTSVDKHQSKPAVAEGWRLLDFYAGRAVVESRNGNLFEIGPGSNLPGLGRVESIKREDRQVTVVTRNGIITAAVEQRPPSPRPYRY
jgi:hypothetical protein